MKHSFTTWSGIVVLALVAGGCSKHEQAQAERTLDRAGSETVHVLKKAGKTTVKALDRAADLTTDAAVTGSVKTRLLADKWLGATGTDVTTKNHVVTLTGKIGSAQQKARATNITKNVVGVRGVINKLHVGK